MAPTLMCLAALIAADPRIDVERVFPATPTPFHSHQFSKTPQTVTSSYRSENTIELETEDEEVRTPFGSVDVVLRGQTPTYVQPGTSNYQSQPELIPPPGGANAQPFLVPPGAIGPQPFLAPPMTTRFYTTYENVFLTPYFSQNTSSISSTGGGAGVPFQSSVSQFNWDLEYSPRFEIGLIGPDNTGWRGRYWHFEHSTNAQVTPTPFGFSLSPGDPITFARIGAGAGGPGFAPATTLTSSHSLRMSVLDLEYIKKSVAGDRGLDVSFGIRYARIDQWMRNRALTAGGATTFNQSMKHDFEGIGPTIAAEYRRPLWGSSWGIFGNARASLMYGDSNYRYDLRGPVGVAATQPPNAYLVASRNNNDRGLQSSFEFQLGLDYHRPLFYSSEFLFRIALEGQYWANAGSASGDQSGLGLPTSPQETDLGFFGFTVATGLTW